MKAMTNETTNAIRTLATMKKIIVHGGIFHLDDVLCVAMARYVNPSIEVERSLERTFEPENGVLVADVGGGEFDHHQPDAALRPDGKKHAACGLMFKAFWREILDSELFYDSFRDTYIIPAEDADNGYAGNPLSSFVSGMNPEWDEEVSLDGRFMEAVEFALTIIRQAVEHCKAVERAAATVHEGKQVGDILILPKYCPWEQEVVTNMPLLNYVIFPSNRGGYMAQVVPDAVGSFGRRQDFPESVQADAPGCTFVHPARFIAGFESVEAAVACLSNR